MQTIQKVVVIQNKIIQTSPEIMRNLSFVWLLQSAKKSADYQDLKPVFVVF